MYEFKDDSTILFETGDRIQLKEWLDEHGDHKTQYHVQHTINGIIQPVTFLEVAQPKHKAFKVVIDLPKTSVASSSSTFVEERKVQPSEAPAKISIEDSGFLDIDGFQDWFQLYVERWVFKPCKCDNHGWNRYDYRLVKDVNELALPGGKGNTNPRCLLRKCQKDVEGNIDDHTLETYKQMCASKKLVSKRKIKA